MTSRSATTWAVNEFSSAVRQGTSTARADARNFVRGLAIGDGTQPAVRGAVFIIGMGQDTINLSVYKTNLEAWLDDAAFWDDMGRYVSDWSQELFGDFRDYGVAGAPLAARRDALDAYLQHVIVHAEAGPAAAASARAYLQAAYSPLANAAWQFDSGFGWTLVPAAQMEDYVSAQTYALRHYGATSQPAGADHWGFAWSPKNTSAMPAADFDAQSGQIIDRLASAIHDSDQSPDPGDPGSSACGIGQSWCATSIAGAAFNDGWKTFAYWGQLALAFTSAPQAVGAGSVSQPLTLQLQAAGTAQTSAADVAVTLASNSPAGAFSSGNGAWTPTLQVTVPAGASTSPAFSYRDTKAGSAVITATATGIGSGTQTEVVSPAALAAITVAPAAATVVAGATQAFTATGADAYGNAVPVAGATWAISPAGLGTLAPGSGSSALFTAGASAGSGTVSATVGTVSGSAALTVSAKATVPGSPVQLTAVTAASRGSRSPGRRRPPRAVARSRAIACTGAPAPARRSSSRRSGTCSPTRIPPRRAAPSPTTGWRPSTRPASHPCPPRRARAPAR